MRVSERCRTASQEGIELDQQLDVRVIALGHLAVRLLDVMLVETVDNELEIGLVERIVDVGLE